MEAKVKEEHKNSSFSGVYDFIWGLIAEGQDAWLMDDKGRFAINWLSAPMRYHTEFRLRNDEVTDRKASNNLRSALLIDKEGAQEYIECQKKNAQGRISERQFQMPARIFESLFGSDVSHTDDGSEQKIDSIITVEDFKYSQETPNHSGDSGYEEAMDTSPDPDVSTDTQCTETSCDTAGIETPIQIFGITEEELKKLLDDQHEVVEGIFPAAGSIEGDLPFVITLANPLPEDDTSEIYVADFDGVGVVELEKFDCSSLSGRTPSTFKPGRVKVTVKTQGGKLLGITSFLYVDHKTQEVLARLLEDRDLQTLYDTLLVQKYVTFGSDSNTANLQPFTLPDQGISEDETDSESGQTVDEDNTSDYFADVETSSSGSSELDAGWPDSEDSDCISFQKLGEVETQSGSSVKKDYDDDDDDDGNNNNDNDDDKYHVEELHGERRSWIKEAEYMIIHFFAAFIGSSRRYALKLEAIKLKKMAEMHKLADMRKELARETKRYAEHLRQLKKTDNKLALQMAGEGYQEEERGRPEVDGKPQETPSSSDTRFDEAVHISDDLFALSTDPSSHFAVGGLRADVSHVDNFESNEDLVNSSEIANSCQMEMSTGNDENWFDEWEVESQKVIQEIIQLNGKLCAEMRDLLKDDMEASSKEKDETHPEELLALFEKMDLLLDKMEKMKLSEDEQALQSIEKEEEERMRHFKELPQL